jgi:cytochrome c-type biogenesis protein CcmH
VKAILVPISFVLSLVLALATPAWASPEDIANDVSRDVMSPYCEGVTLHDCSSREALVLRQRIATWAEDGMSRGAIIDRLVDEFGPQIRAYPSPGGAGLLAWILPALALAAGLVLATVLARRFSARTPDDGAAAKPITAEQRARLDAEIEAFGGKP